MKTLISIIAFILPSILYSQTVSIQGKSMPNGRVMLYKNRTQTEITDVSSSGKYSLNGLVVGNIYNIHFLPTDQSTYVQKSFYIDLSKGTLNEDTQIQLDCNLEPISNYKSTDVFFESVAVFRLSEYGIISLDAAHSAEQQKRINSFKVDFEGPEYKVSLGSPELIATEKKESENITEFVYINGQVIDDMGKPIRNKKFELAHLNEKLVQTSQTSFSTNSAGNYELKLKIRHHYRATFSMPGKVEYHIRISSNLSEKTNKAVVDRQIVNILLKDQTNEMKIDLYNFSVSYFGRTHHFVNVGATRYIQRYEIQNGSAFKNEKKALKHLKNGVLNQDIKSTLSKVSTYDEYKNFVDRLKLDEQQALSYYNYYRAKDQKKDQDILVSFQQIIMGYHAEIALSKNPDLKWSPYTKESKRPQDPTTLGIMKLYNVDLILDSGIKKMRVGLIQVDGGWKFHQISMRQ